MRDVKVECVGDVFSEWVEPSWICRIMKSNLTKTQKDINRFQTFIGFSIPRLYIAWLLKMREYAEYKGVWLVQFDVVVVEVKISTER